MESQLLIGEEELQVLAMMLSRERETLIVEERRTDTPDFKSQLRHRLDVVEHILDKVQRRLEPVVTQ